MLREAGIESVPERACDSADAAVAAAERLGFPVVMKILSPDILHKSEIGGVLLDEVAGGVAVLDPRFGGVGLAEQGETARDGERLRATVGAAADAIR